MGMLRHLKEAHDTSHRYLRCGFFSEGVVPQPPLLRGYHNLPQNLRHLIHVELQKASMKMSQLKGITFYEQNK